MTPDALPNGWVKQVDPQTDRAFYVDTEANPPRSIWTHPYEDEVYLSEHPERRHKVRGSNSFGSDASLALPPSYDSLPRRHSFSGRAATPIDVPPPKHKQGLFRRMKEKAAHSMEQHNERKKQQMLLQQQQMQQLYDNPQYLGTRYSAPQYAYPQRDYYSGYGGFGSSSMGRRHGGMGGMALPLMGGMAGGLLLGDLVGGGMGGGFGGGGFDGGLGGGGFGGGGFDGGGFGGGFGGGGFGF